MTRTGCASQPPRRSAVGSAFPPHAHAVAAGLLARAGEPDDLDAARRALDTATATEAWRDDRSYLWSLFIGGLATAAVRLGDRELCTQLLAELQPLTGTCGVGGSLVCFVGSNAHWAGIVAAALGRAEQAHRWLNEALTVHRRLGARTWEAETHLELAALGADDRHAERAAQLATELGLTGVLARLSTIHGNPPPASPNEPTAELCRDGELWRIRYRNTAAHLRDAKGLADLHTLLARPGTDVHVLELAGATHAEPASGTLLDATARAAYRRRLAELDQDLAAARADHDIGRAHHLDTQRTALIAELRRATGLAGRSRSLGDEHHRTSPQDGHLPTTRSDPPHPSRPPRARRTPRPLDHHRHHLPLPAHDADHLETQSQRQVARIPTADAERPVTGLSQCRSGRTGRLSRGSWNLRWRSPA